MTIYCVRCKKEPIPGDKSRSFHKFPNDDGLKQKWMNFVGISSVTKHTKLWSDHFDKSADADSDGYTTKRCLLKIAAPCRFVCTDKIQSGSYSVAKDQTQLNLQKQQCESSVGVNSIVNLHFSINNDLPVNTIKAVGENKQEFGEPLSCRILDSSVAVDLGTSSNVSKSCCVNISINNSSTQVLKEQVIQQTLFNNTQSNDNRTNLKRSMPLCDIADVSPSKRLYSHSESGPNVLKSICKKSQPNIIHANLKRSLPGTDCSENSDVSPSKKLCSSNVFESSPSKIVPNNLESNEARTNTKRHMPYIDISNIPSTKKFRFFDGPQPMHMSRKDFATNEAWSRFLKFTIYKNRQAESRCKKNERKTKQIGNIKELVSKLREENATAAADYLQVI